MTGRFSLRHSWTGLFAAAALAAGIVPAPASAQADDRLERIETQLRALQRAVFPGGDERFFEPEITPGQPQQQTPSAGRPSTSALTDVLARLDAMERQLSRLTAATEVNENALAGVEERLEALEAAEAAAPPPPSAASTGPSGVIELPGEEEEEAEEEAGPSPERLAAVQAIAKPATGDQGDDEYVYGFRLWDAGFFPEAQQQLSLFLEQYPDHWRATYARNLLGRAYLDDDQPRVAATHFFENFRADETAARAPDSLLYLAESMIALGDTNRACLALAEFGDTYPALATGRLQEQYESNRSRVDCT